MRICSLPAPSHLICESLTLKFGTENEKGVMMKNTNPGFFFSWVSGILFKAEYWWFAFQSRVEKSGLRFFFNYALFILRAKYETPTLEIKVRRGDLEAGLAEIGNSFSQATYRPSLQHSCFKALCGT